MATVTDSLIITLGLDGSNLAKGAKQAKESIGKLEEGTKNTGESLKKTGKDGADAFAAFRREAVGALALFTGGKSLMGFTKDITEANTALGNLSRQLDIAPQKLTQLHYAMRSVGGNEGSVDSFLQRIQSMKVTPEGRAELTNIGAQLGINFLDKNDHVRGDILEQLHQSKAVQSHDRGWVDAILARVGGNSDISTLATSRDFSENMKHYENIGPTNEDIRRGQELQKDWTELQANSDKLMRQVYRDLEPSIHNFIQSLIALEKAHPDEIAHGIKDMAIALTIISGLLTARGFLSSLKVIAGVAGKGGIVGIGSFLGQIGMLDTMYHIANDDSEWRSLSAEMADEIRKQKENNRYKSPEDQKKIKDALDDAQRHADGNYTTWGDIKSLWEALPSVISKAEAHPTNNTSTPQNDTPPIKEAAGMARGERNNNPGNLRFARQDGARPEDPANPKQGFAVFNTPEEGLSALKRQLTLYNTRDHLDTVSDIISKYAPPSDHNKTKAYIETASQRLGVEKDQHLGTLSPRVMAALMHAIIGVENGHDRYGSLVDRIAAQTPPNRARQRTDQPPKPPPLTLPPSFLSALTKTEEDRKSQHGALVGRLAAATQTAAATSTTTHNTTHNNTTNAPVIHMTVHSGNTPPHEMAKAIHDRITQTVASNDRTRVN
ncbi:MULTISPECIES: hypothetical protein [unclassified Saccharibacter]|uniref:hypothetical protein n=1 Tax=unclassified Saccharibacter TaxID=2648722 RepID=UPI0019279DCA|nr:MULTISPECIES: hypothetical protein [unclassified Saccharibacter]